MGKGKGRSSNDNRSDSMNPNNPAYWASVEKLFSLPRRAFWPPPEVTSTVVRVTRRPGREAGEQYGAFAEVVRRLFSGRRKTIGSVLKRAWDRETADRAFGATGLDPSTRVDALGIEDFVAIARLTGPPRG